MALSWIPAQLRLKWLEIILRVVKILYWYLTGTLERRSLYMWASIKVTVHAFWTEERQRSRRQYHPTWLHKEARTGDTHQVWEWGQVSYIYFIIKTYRYKSVNNEHWLQLFWFDFFSQKTHNFSIVIFIIYIYLRISHKW